jgi:hypothetical protein
MRPPADALRPAARVFGGVVVVPEVGPPDYGAGTATGASVSARQCDDVA